MSKLTMRILINFNANFLDSPIVMVMWLSEDNSTKLLTFAPIYIFVSKWPTQLDRFTTFVSQVCALLQPFSLR